VSVVAARLRPYGCRPVRPAGRPELPAASAWLSVVPAPPKRGISRWTDRRLSFEHPGRRPTLVAKLKPISHSLQATPGHSRPPSVRLNASVNGTRQRAPYPELITHAASKRRGHREGSACWDASRNRCIGALALGFSPAGTRIRKKVSGKTKVEVRDKLCELHEQVDVSLRSDDGTPWAARSRTGWRRASTVSGHQG